MAKPSNGIAFANLFNILRNGFVTGCPGFAAALDDQSIGADWFNNRPNPEFYGYALPSISWYVVMMLSIAAVIARRSDPPVDFTRVLVFMLAAMPVIIALECLRVSYLQRSWAAVATVVTIVYGMTYLSMALSGMTGRRQPAAVISGLMVTVGFMWVTSVLYISPSVWMPQEYAAGADDKTWRDAEKLLFYQSERIDRALAKIAPVSGEKPTVYFLGFAGVAEQRVFAEEIKLAARVVDRRYGSDARSIYLLNDRRDLETQPFANTTALRYALRGLASKMNIQNDVLVLSLSSHGAEGELSVSNGAMRFQNLTAADLASALRESGIKWRIIIVSACHAGSFIEPLRDPNTIVIAAAAADKTSFGCADDRDLTYFGEAFYRDALPKTSSLREAFAVAKAGITERETREKKEVSAPQAFFGQEIERKMASL